MGLEYVPHHLRCACFLNRCQNDLSQAGIAAGVVVSTNLLGKADKFKNMATIASRHLGTVKNEEAIIDKFTAFESLFYVRVDVFVLWKL